MSLENGQEQGFVSDADIKAKLLSQHQQKEIKENNFPYETIELPSKGWYYPEGHPLSSGVLDMRYMTAKDEDILTSANLRKQKVVIERLLQNLIVTPGVQLKDVLAVDVFALMLAARVLGYGKDYTVEISDPEHPINKQKVTIDLTTLEEIEHTFLPENKGKNLFEFTLPKCGKQVKYKLLTYQEDLELSNKNSNTTTIKNKVESTLTDALKKQIVEIDGNTDRNFIDSFIDNLLAMDSKELRVHIAKHKPGIDTKIIFTSEINGNEHEIDLPLTTEFFWPTT